MTSSLQLKQVIILELELSAQSAIIQYTKMNKLSSQNLFWCSQHNITLRLTFIFMHSVFVQTKLSFRQVLYVCQYFVIVYLLFITMNNAAFNIDSNFIAERLFQPAFRRIGALTHLNVNVLPDFIMYIKNQMSPEEVLNLADYQLQTYILELSLQKSNKNLSQLTEKILAHIRGGDEFWQKKRTQIDQKQQKMHQHQAIQQYAKDLQNIESKRKPQSDQKTFMLLRTKRCHQRKQFSMCSIPQSSSIKLCFNNYSLIPVYIMNRLKATILQKVSNNQIDQIRKKMQKGVQNFFAYPKSDIKKQKQPSRQLSRNRPNKIQPKSNELEQQQQQCQQNLLQVQNQNEDEQISEFYLQFQKWMKKIAVYDPKTLLKQNQINLAHNILQILRFIVYKEAKKQSQWFRQKIKQYEQIVQRKKQEQQSQQEQSQSEKQKQIQPQHQQKSLNEQQNKNQANIEAKVQIQQRSLRKQQAQKMDVQIQSPLKQQQQNRDADNKSIKKKQQNVNDKIELNPLTNLQFNQEWKTPNFNYINLAKNLQRKLLNFRQIYFIAQQYLLEIFPIQMERQIQTKKVQDNSKSFKFAKGLLTTSQDLQRIQQEFKEMIEHPQNVKLSKFKTVGTTIPWEEEDYINFLKGFMQYYYVPTNNKRIATFMSKKGVQIQANHVKHIKSIYMKNMQIRIDKGECGGGKRGRTLIKTQFVKLDIQNFQMKYLKKIKKGKKKRTRRLDSDEQDQVQIDSEY